eukprot:11173264-Lingulodinium_polyedra.AAC.1
MGGTRRLPRLLLPWPGAGAPPRPLQASGAAALPSDEVPRARNRLHAGRRCCHSAGADGMPNAPQP